MDPSSVKEMAPNHSDECVNSFDKEDHPIHDEIFSILFPSSPIEGNEEKDITNNYLEEPLTNTEIEPILPSNEDLVFDYSDASLSDDESKKKSFSQDSKNNGNESKSKYENIQNEDTKENSNRAGNEKISNNTMCKEVIESKSTHAKKSYKYSDNRNVDKTNKYKRKISEKTKKSVNIENQDLKRGNFIEDISDKEKQNNELNLKNEDTLEDISDNENEEFFVKKVYLEEISDDEAAHRREWATGGKINKDPRNWKLAASSSSSILKRLGPVVESAKSHERLGPVVKPSKSHERSRKFGKPSKSHERSRPVVKPSKSHERSRPVVKPSKSHERSRPVVKPSKSHETKSHERKYDEIIIVGDERLPLLESYKNVKILREERLQLKDIIPFIRKSDLHTDKQFSRMVIICVGLNDLIEKVPSKDCFIDKGNNNTHSSCYLFRYRYVRHDLFNEIMKEVKKINEYLPISCKVIFSCLHLFDLSVINNNLSLEHYDKYGHQPQLSESDDRNNKTIHDRIKKVNSRLSDMTSEKVNLLHIEEHTMRDYQVTNDIKFSVQSQKLMVNNIKKIQNMYSNSHEDVHSSHNKDNVGHIIDQKESDVDNIDLRLVLNSRNKQKVLNSEISREFKTDKKLANQTNNSGKSTSNINSMEGHQRKGWHSPEHCISPTGWHPVDICRKKEQERIKRELIERKERQLPRSPRKEHLDKGDKSRNLCRKDKERIYRKTGYSDMSPRRFSSEMNTEGKTRNSSRIDTEGRIYVKSGSLRGKGTEDREDTKSRHSRMSESSSTRRGNEGSIDRSFQKSRSSSRTVEKELDTATYEALRNLAEVHDRSCKMYIDHPAAHPDYNKEYQLFYKAKSEKIREIGGDPLQYDFSPEWQGYWQMRSKIIFRETWLTMKNQCIKMVQEKKLKKEKNKHEERSHRSTSVSSSATSSRSSSRSSSTMHRSKRKRSSDKGKSDYKKDKRRSEDSHSSPPIKKKQKYGENDLFGRDGYLNRMKDHLQLDNLNANEFRGMDELNSINESLEMSLLTNRMHKQDSKSSQKPTFHSGKTFNLPLPSADEENGIGSLGLEEVGESVIPFNLGKYVPEYKKCNEKKTIEKSNDSDNVLDVLIMLTQLGDKMGSLAHPIKSLFDKANQENMKNNGAINIFTDPDASMVMQLVNSKLIIAINNDNTNVIEKVIFQEVKTRVEKLMRSVEETFVEGVNIEYIAKKSLGMGSSEIVDFIKFVLKLSASGTVSSEKMMKIYQAVKEKQFRYVETTSNISKNSDSLEMAFPMQFPGTHNDKDVNVSTEIPFNLPTRQNSNSAEKYDPFE